MDSLPIVLKDLGRAIVVLREQTGLSQEHFAGVIGIHRTEMGRLELGKTNPTVKTLHLVAGGLGVSLGALFARAESHGREAPMVAGSRSKRVAKPSGRGARKRRRGK